MPGVGAGDLSPVALERFRSLAARSGRLDAAALAEPDASLLAKLKLTEGRYLKRAAVLLFHPDPLNFVAGAFVKVGFFRSASDLVYHDEIIGDLFSQVQQTLDLLFTKYLKAAITYEDIVRVERFPVPREAMREAILNALVHRDYAVPAPMQIRVYDDKLAMVNPAVLPEGWTQASLLESHHSHPFNPDIANAFFRAGEIEAWGRGIERIFDACREAGTPRPALRFQANGLWIEFPFAKEYLDVIHGAGASRVSGRITDPVADPVADPVVELLRILADGPLPPSAIQKTLGLKHRPTFRANYLYRAMERGLIEMTIPETPSSRLQKYRLTVEGRALLDSLDKA